MTCGALCRVGSFAIPFANFLYRPCPLLRVRRTSPSCWLMSANDPKRTSGESASYRKRTSLRSTSQDLWALKSVSGVDSSLLFPLHGIVSRILVQLGKAWEIKASVDERLERRIHLRLLCIEKVLSDQQRARTLDSASLGSNPSPPATVDPSLRRSPQSSSHPRLSPRRKMSAQRRLRSSPRVPPTIAACATPRSAEFKALNP